MAIPFDRDAPRNKRSPRPIRFFVPGPSSRFFPSIHSYLKNRRIDIKPANRELRLHLPEARLDVYLARGFDIPRLLEEGWGDLGITGLDAVAEAHSSVEILAELGIRWSRVVVASAKLADVAELEGDAVVVTEYPSLSAAYFAGRGLRHLKLRYVSGAAECFASHPEVACIVTLETSGATLRANHLTVLDVLMETEACLIRPPLASGVDEERMAELVCTLTASREEAFGGQESQEWTE